MSDGERERPGTGTQRDNTEVSCQVVPSRTSKHQTEAWLICPACGSRNCELKVYGTISFKCLDCGEHHALYKVVR